MATTSTSVIPRQFQGQVINPDDPRYDSARTLWNAAIDRRPQLIARPESAEDVALAIAGAREAGLEIAVRGGGHSLAGHSMSEGGVTIDLGAMRGVKVDPVGRRARIGGGALLIDAAEATAPHALTIPYGHVSHTGIGGLTLGGGIGWVARSFGLAVDSLRGATVVTADGDVVEVSEDQHPDLLWGLRGGGGNFGVVTEFEFDLHPHGPLALAGMLVYPIDRAADAMRLSRDFMADAPRELTVYEALITAPPEPPFPAELQGRPVLAIGMVCTGPVEAAERMIRPLREGIEPALDLVEPMPIVATQTMLDPTAPPGNHNANRARWLEQLPDAAVDTLVEKAASMTSPLSQVLNAQMGGAILDAEPESAAFAHRDANRICWIVATWGDGLGEEHIDWCVDLFESLEPYAKGGSTYVNALGDEGLGRLRASYGESWGRLVELKRAWDPDNLFAANQNIPPTG